MDQARAYQIAIPTGNVPRHITIEDNIPFEKNGPLAILRDLVLYSPTRQQSLSYQTGKFKNSGLAYDTWMAILSISLGLDYQQLEYLGNFALHRELQNRAVYTSLPSKLKLPLFSISASDVSFDVLTPLILGDVTTAEQMINANLKHLLAKGFATGFCGKIIGPVTPLQLAVCVGDTDFLPVIDDGFARLTDGFAEKHNQLKEILHRSFHFYLKKYEADIIRLYALKESPSEDTHYAEIDNKLTLAKKNH